MFGLFKKKESAPAKPVWPFTDPSMSEEKVRAAAQMGVRRLRLEARPESPEYPPMITNAVKTPEQSAAIKRVWKEEVLAAVDQRAAMRGKPQGV